MFKPKSPKIKALYKKKKSQPDFLNKKILIGKTYVYIDWANVFYWQNKLGWHIDIKKLYQFLSSFDQIGKIKLYQGYFDDNQKSKDSIDDYKNIGYEVRTKTVKEIHIDIDAKSFPIDDPSVIKRVVCPAFLKRLPVQDVEAINQMIRTINDNGEYYLIQHKCNFDVEMACDIRIDALNEKDIETFVIVSGDSDFIDTVESLINDGKNVVVMSTNGRISSELSNSKAYKYDIKQVKNFLCWNKEVVL